LLLSAPFDAPGDFTAVLMPSLFGPELFILRAAGVPPSNVFVIERDPEVHHQIRNPEGAELEHLRGVRTTEQPLPLHQAVERIPFSHLSLVYFDLFGQPDGDHYLALFRLFRLHRLRRGAVLLLTCGVNRGDPFSCQVNAQITEPTGQAYIEAALTEARHRSYEALNTYSYVSEGLNFSVTEVRF
jgi:hypothetical protein